MYEYNGHQSTGAAVAETSPPNDPPVVEVRAHQDRPSADPEADATTLLAILPEDGSSVSNPRLQAELGWEDERYWAARDQLEDAKLVARGRGKGGTVRRIVANDEPGDNCSDGGMGDPYGAKPGESQAVVREDSLYEPISHALKEWQRDRRADPLATEITARQGRRSTGGMWSRPDLVSVEVKTYEYVPGKYLEVVTFEVKPSDAIDVSAVYEALAHRRAATHAYVVLHVPNEQSAALDSAITEVRLVARTHGIGVITMADPAEYGTWDELEEAERVEPNPERLNQFIENQLSDSLRRRIARTLR